MKYKGKSSANTVSIPSGIAVGITISFIVLLLGIAFVAKLIDKELLADDKIGYCVMVLLLVTSCIAAMVSYGKIKQKRMFVCILTGIVYFVILLSVTIVFFEGRFSGVAETGGLVICGSAVAILPALGRKRHMKSPKIKYRNC